MFEVFLVIIYLSVIANFTFLLMLIASVPLAIYNLIMDTSYYILTLNIFIGSFIFFTLIFTSLFIYYSIEKVREVYE